jgi:hypothetical protein
VADPAARRLPLRSRAVRTAPRRHERMVAAMRPNVTAIGPRAERPVQSRVPNVRSSAGS